MGGILRRIEFFVSGQAYQQALAVMRATRKRKRVGTDERHQNGNIAVTPSTWHYIKDFFIGEPSTVKTSLNGDDSNMNSSISMSKAEFFFIQSTQTNIKLSKSNYLQKQQIDERKI